MSVQTYALLDGSNVIQRLVQWDGVDAPSQFGSLTPVLVPGGADPNPGDILSGGVVTRGTALDVLARQAIITQVRAALVRMRQIRDSPQITTANLANLQAVQAAVQDEARALIGLIRVMLNQFDGTT